MKDATIINLNTLLTKQRINKANLKNEITYFELQNLQMNEQINGMREELELKKKSKIFGVVLNDAYAKEVDEVFVKEVIKKCSRARTLFNIKYKVNTVMLSDILKIAKAFKGVDGENDALHLKAVFESSRFHNSAFGVARNKDKYFNIFINENLELYVLDKGEIYPYSEANIKHEFTQYWI